MKKLVSTLVILFVLAGLFSPLETRAAVTASTPAKTAPPPGVQIAQTLSTITGVAISPLLGVSAVGCYQYCKAETPEQKAKLPWFANPLFWVPAFLVLAACFVKDTAGVALPTVAKKPLDAIETIEHKISGLVATGAFVPIMVNIIHEANSTGGQPVASMSSLGLAAMDFHWLYDVLVTPVAMIAFFIVFLASNAINILILISPFGAVDAALKAFRTSIIASVALTSFANPWIGAAWALIVLLISSLIAGWSFRLSHFGLSFIWDFVTRRCNRFKPDPTVNKLFLGRKIDYVPARTYGRLSRDDKGNLVLKYRPWLVLAERTLTLPATQYAAGKGVFFSEILQLDGDNARIALLLPPRYRGHELELVAIYGLTGVRDTGLLAAWSWFKSMLGFKTKIPAS